MADRSVALVGNSTRILRDRPARQIDSADIVIRINRGLPQVIDPSAIGERTDVWATAKHWRDLHVPADTKLVVWMKLTPLGREQVQTFRSQHPDAPLARWTAEHEHDCREFVGADPGTGIRMLWWLRHHARPRAVSVYGMDCWEEPTHWSGKMQTKNHKPDLERAAMLRLL